MTRPRREPTISTRQALRAMSISAVVRDLGLIVLGVLGMAASLEDELPPTIVALGIDGPAAVVWSTGFLLGGALSLAGGLRPDGWDGRGDEIQAGGCGIVGMAFAIWAVAAIAQPDATLVSWMVAIVFVTGVAGQSYRIAVVAAGVPRLTRYLIERGGCEPCAGHDPERDQ